jgi:hypothetical protein
MHNGLLIYRGSYCGETLSVLLELNAGLHEPQEERVFQEVLKFVRPGGTILELGAYWGFYSMWFSQRVGDAKCILVEPDPRNLAHGKANFALNKLEAEFLQGYVGCAPNGVRDPVYSVDELTERYKIKNLSVLHSDIQGAELEMLRGAKKAFGNGIIDYAFISTHSDALHEQCLQFLIDREFVIIAEANASESFSADGVIAARKKGIAEPAEVPISKRLKN